jgi:aminoglycoside phosphotransferase (APT) family kinase protein
VVLWCATTYDEPSEVISFGLFGDSVAITTVTLKRWYKVQKENEPMALDTRSKIIGESKATTAYLCGRETVLLVGKNETAFANFGGQAKIYGVLENKIDFIDIPHNAKLIKPCEKYPFGAMTISYVAGEQYKLADFTELEKAKLGKQLAKFIFDFQKVGEKLTTQEMATIQSVEVKTDGKAARECLALVKKHLTTDEFAKLEYVVEIYQNAIKNKKRILHHGDLNLGNLKFDTNKNLIGVLDFESVGFFIPEYKINYNKWGKDEALFNAVAGEYKKLGGLLDTDKKFGDICEIMTMIFHLRVFYCLGKSQIDIRVGIVKDLLQKY